VFPYLRNTKKSTLVSTLLFQCIDFAHYIRLLPFGYLDKEDKLKNNGLSHTFFLSYNSSKKGEEVLVLS